MTVSYIVFVAAVLLFFFSAAFVLLFRRLSRCPSRPGAAGPREISLANYRPMERLLGEDDMRFLAAQPGISPGVIRRLRRDRRAVFSDYLRALCRDFNRLFLAARVLLVASSEDRPDLAVALLKIRLNFMLAVLMVRGRLLLRRFGWGTVDVRGFLGQLDVVREHVARWNAQLAPQRVSA